MKKIWNNYSYALILIAVTFIFSILFAGQLKSVEKEYITVTVKEGDSLWVLAEELADTHNQPVNEFVAWIEKENRISDGRIYAGDELVVPIVQTEDGSTELAGLDLYE
ncbi:cell division suppressor protein YneA [Mesobacillus foraminis]|uniref:LysM domain-containing protein n=1 Tax=Mesobacillus foraminis TaxID=279826 RepID=A0A4V2RDN6_9BACI|nr:LysM peptidoglycan-binding domain-containing protein [Mesobacillus foraminis]TCN25520.1 LysM domain-containing protein [Mesobacillus foraminis]